MNQWLLLALSVFLFNSITSQGKIPRIDVFEESLCPGCSEFVLTSLNEFVQFNIPNLAVVNLIPYGNAHEKKEGDKWEFTCQHGKNECYGNLMETCIIHLYGRDNSYLPIMCITASIHLYQDDFDRTLAVCVSEEGTKAIKNCMESDLGNRLQHEMALKTIKHEYVPYILVDGVHNEAIQEEITTSLVGYLCSRTPANCENKYQTKWSSMKFLGDFKCYNDN